MEAKYKLIYNEIKDRIIHKAYVPNGQIPDELSLCKEFNSSRMTVKKALDLLVHEGMLYRKRGQGSFVMELNTTSDRLNIPERELLGLSKSTHGKTKSKVLEFSLIFANEKIAKNLNIKENDPVYNILRLRLIKDVPYVLERTYMSPSLIPGITEQVLTGSVYDYIEDTLGYRIASAQKTTRACTSNKDDQQYLQLQTYEPVLEIEQIAYLDNGRPFEYSFSRHHYDLFEFTLYSVRY